MNASFPNVDFWALTPVIIVSITACAVLLIDIFTPISKGKVYPAVAVLGQALALIVALIQLGDAPVTTFGGSWRTDRFSLFFTITVLISGILGVLICDSWLRIRNLGRSEFYTLLLCSVAGVIVTASAHDLITLFIGIELTSIPTYILTGFAKHDQRSNEASLKYFLLGAFSTAILLYGLTWLFGITGGITYPEIAAFGLGPGDASKVPLLFAVLLIIVGLGFKSAAVPFHMWTPDAYQGAPTVVTAFMSVSVKAGAFAALTRLMVEAVPDLYGSWGPVLAVIAVLTMFVGNIVAIVQEDVKRMLAYSSVGHTGFILAGLAGWVPNNDMAVASVLFYSFVYVFMNLGAFGILAWLENHGGNTLLDSMDGLFLRFPQAAGALAIFLLALMGFPLTAGLPAKVFVFLGAADGGYTWLGVLVFVASIISAVFYLKVMVRMFMYEPKVALASPRQPDMAIALGVCAIATVLLGILFMPILNLALSAT